MNTGKSKLQTSTKIVIKEEKKDLHPMMHYIDDRVELVKQIFATLKPKTIKNLAPEFLKGSSVEEIEELCLGELLGISTKRLTSIIDATKCPTDTESSDSDVNKIEEHISLEEISSDSEEEKSTRISKIADIKNRKKGNTSNPNEENTKEISVLELLELQARARAIRSQLALEPIAKIEVDSDDSIKSNKNRPDKSKRKKQTTTKKSQISNHGDKSSISSSINGDIASSLDNISKRIKLKRNFRKSKRDDDSEQDDSRLGHGNEPQKGEKNILIQENDIKEKVLKREKSPSPDVITILPSPETLCISDSSEEETEENSSEKKTNEESMTNVINSIEKNESIKNKNITGKEENTNSKEHEKIDSEIEDGEIYEKEEHENAVGGKSQIVEGITKDALNEADCEESPISKTPDVNLNHNNNDANDEIEPGYNSNSDEQHILSCNEDPHNDDVISLEHEELDYEMKDNIEEYGKCQDLPEQQEDEKSIEGKMCESTDYIELHNDSSDNENETIQQQDANTMMESSSWNSRWLQSAKVAKILAASRLGNRVRDKIKKSKKSEQTIAENKPEPPTTSLEQKFASTFEDGTLQQYHEIIERGRFDAESTTQ